MPERQLGSAPLVAEVAGDLRELGAAILKRRMRGLPRPPATRLSHAMRRIAASGPGSRVLAPVMPRLDKAVFRLSCGRMTAASALTGLPVVLLTTRGARSGRARSVPVLGLPTPDGLAVIASNWGRRRDPAWCHNLRAYPEVEVTLGGGSQRYRAFEARGELRERVWRMGLGVYPGWGRYARRTRGRPIPVFVLQPRD